MKITALVGEPCVGKSTIAKALLGLSEWQIRRPKYLAHHADLRTRACLMGLYEEGQQFPGTDRLSMGVQPHMERVIRSGRVDALLWEGDRLSSGKLFRLLLDLGHDFKLYHITCPPAVLSARRAAEREQSSPFIARCRTKIANILAEFDHTEVSMTRPEDAGDLARLLYGTRT